MSDTDGGKQVKILVAEDNELNLKLFNDILSAHHFVTVETGDGDKVVDLAAREMPNLIIMDIQLPNQSGVDIIKNLKTMENLKHIPIIAVTAFAMTHDRQRIMEAGCEDYIAKPIDIHEFLSVVRRYV